MIIINKITAKIKYMKQGRARDTIEKILADTRHPRPNDSEELFNNLLCRYPDLPIYRYDTYNSWLRGTQRAQQMYHLLESIRIPGLKILEAGCGDGMTGAILDHYGHQVTFVDIEDWRDARAKQLEFVSADLCDKLPLKDNLFEMIFSFNTFEHLETPYQALRELIRICKPKGYIFLEFGPLYYSPFGLHALSLRMPYPQILFSEDFIQRKITEIGVNDLGKEMKQLQPLNKWSLRQYEKLFEESGCQIIQMEKLYNTNYLSTVLEFPGAFWGRSLSLEDISVNGLRIILKK